MATATTSSEHIPSRETLSAYERVEGIHVLRLRGSDYEMGFQHGRLLKDSIPHGPIPYFAKWVEKLMQRGFFGPLTPFSKVLGITQPGGMTLRKPCPTRPHDPAKIRSVPLAGGGMTLQIGWRHDPAKNCLQVAA